MIKKLYQLADRRTKTLLNVNLLGIAIEGLLMAIGFVFLVPILQNILSEKDLSISWQWFLLIGV